MIGALWLLISYSAGSHKLPHPYIFYKITYLLFVIVHIPNYIAPVMLAVANGPISLVSTAYVHKIYYATQGILLCKN